MMIGRSISMSWISGCRRSRSVSSSRLRSSWSIWTDTVIRPNPDSGASVRRDSSSTPSGSRNDGSPKSSSPTVAAAWAMSASAVSSMASPMGAAISIIAAVSGSKTGSARSSMWTASGLMPDPPA